MDNAENAYKVAMRWGVVTIEVAQNMIGAANSRVLETPAKFVFKIKFHQELFELEWFIGPLFAKF